MSAAARHTAEVDAPEITGRPTLGLASADAEAIASPARILQQQLEHSFGDAVRASTDHCYPEPHIEKLHPSMRLGILAALTVGSWGVIIVGLRAIF